jgi:Flp pilus assembly pilin Flp
MTKNMARKWTQSFASLRNDERGAEATEVIFILVIVVLGLAAGFIALTKALNKKSTDIQKCVNGVSAVGAKC